MSQNRRNGRTQAQQKQMGRGVQEGGKENGNRSRERRELDRGDLTMLIFLAEWRINMLTSQALIDEGIKAQREKWGKILVKLEKLKG